MGKASGIQNRSSTYSSRAHSRKRDKDISKSKRHRYHDYTDSDSTTSTSLSFSTSSSGSCRISKSRYQSDDVKGHRKMYSCQLCSSSSERAPSMRVKNKSIKYTYSKVGRKKKKKKGEERKRSRSDESCSCSSCQSWTSSSSSTNNNSNSSNEGNTVRWKALKEHNREKGKDVKHTQGTRSQSNESERKERYGSRRWSCWQECKEVKVCDENTPKRLRSVITLIKDQTDVQESSKDGNKEEMQCDHDDYPYLSNDSNDGGNNKVAASLFNDAQIERNKEEKYNEKRDAHLPPISKGDDNLELALRQKALENLRKFRRHVGGIDREDALNSKGENTMEDESKEKHAISQNEEASDSGPSLPFEAVSSVKLPEESPEGGGHRQLEQKTMPLMKGGEVVQVSYKVYIPKKIPALSRRKLIR